jgi:hypothetical protein
LPCEGYFRQALGARDAGRDWKAKHCPQTAPDRACNFSWWTEEMGATRDIEKASSMEIRSASGVKSLSTLMAASPALLEGASPSRGRA